ncbi:hypothetical protein Lesp01_50930 [Lentzea sp. NBRC 102530]|nr:hypothetical protein Lesp01_50930 [Lentzea sp. NBRC 102530]
MDLSILGLLIGIRQLALAGASLNVPRPARRLLMFASAVTLALNVADRIVAGEYGKAAFDAVGPLLLIGWAEVGPGLLQAMGAIRVPKVDTAAGEYESAEAVGLEPAPPQTDEGPTLSAPEQPSSSLHLLKGDLLARARHEDAVHRAVHQRPISADALRGKLGIGSALARRLVKSVRAEFQQSYGSMSRDLSGSSRSDDSRVTA